MIRDESDAKAELRKLLTNLEGAGVTGELAAHIRESAEEVFRGFPRSREVAELYDRIQRAAQPAPTPEPDSCRELRERLAGSVTAKTVVAALEESGFRGRREFSMREEECFRDAIRGPLQSLRASYESPEGFTPVRVRASIDSLREVLAALPPDILAPRQVLEQLVHRLELSTAREQFRGVLEGLRGRVERQDLNLPAEQLREVSANVWAEENPAAPEVEEAQKHLARLEELQRANSLLAADAARARELIEKRRDYDSALNELRLAETRLRQTGLRERGPLDDVLAALAKGLAEIYEWEERAAEDPAPTEAALEKSLANLQRLGVWLQKMPDAEGQGAEVLRQKCDALMKRRALPLNDLRLSRARRELEATAVEDVPAYVERLRSFNLVELREWAATVQRVWEALQHLGEAGTADRMQLSRLERAEQELGPSPLTRAASQRAADYRTKAARAYLRESAGMVEGVEDAARALSDAPTPALLGEAINSVADLILRYRRKQDQESEAYADAQRVAPDECGAHDRRVRSARQTVLPEAVNRWAEETVNAAGDGEAVAAARRAFAAWREVLGKDFPHAEIERRFDERSAELEIRALEAEGKFDEAQRLLNEKKSLLSASTFLEFQRQLGRRQAARRYTPGREADIAAAVREHGPDPELLRILVEDFRARGDCGHLASVYECLRQIEAVDAEAARLVRWSFDFKSEELEGLARALASSASAESVTLFAKGIAAGAQHAAALRVLRAALAAPGHWPPAALSDVEASYQMLSDRVAANCSAIEAGLSELEKRSDPGRQDTPRRDPRDDAELLQQVEEALASARVFLDQAIPEVARWRDYLSTAARFGVEFESSLLAEVRELDERLATDRNFFRQLSTAWRAVVEKGWEQLADLYKVAQLGFTRKTAPVGAVVRLLLQYVKNYQPVVGAVDRLVEARGRGGEGLSREELDELLSRLNAEARYDFRPGQDRFRLAARFSGKGYPEFVRELEAMVTEIEAVEDYRAQLFHLLIEQQQPLRLRVQQGSAMDKREIADILRRPDTKGQTLLGLYRNPPCVTTSRAAAALLDGLRQSDTFELLARAVALADGQKD